MKYSPIALTKGHRMDRLSERIIKGYCQPDFNCIDIGAHTGEILDVILSAAPGGRHFAFEPLPHLYAGLQTRYGQRVQVFNCALSDETRRSSFQHVTSNPAYSGIKRRLYDRKNESIEEIQVELRRLDDCIPAEVPIHFIKIDVEGAELLTLKGGDRILGSHKPMILFEHGLKGASCYGYDANDIWEFLISHGYAIHTLTNYINDLDPLSRDALVSHFNLGDEFYFVAT